MTIFSAQISSLSCGFSRFLFRSSCQHAVFGSHRQLSSIAGNTKKKNVYGDDLFSDDNASEVPSAVEKLPDIVSEALPQTSGLEYMFPDQLLKEGLEMLHFSIGLPWWGAIATGVAITKLCLFPLVVKNRQEIKKWMVTINELNEAAANVAKAVKEERSEDALKLFQQLEATKKKLPFWPLVLTTSGNAVGFLTMVFAIRGLQSQHFESLQTGGIGWFSSLSAPDPLGILPFINISSILFTLLAFRDPSHPLPKPLLWTFYALCPVAYFWLIKYNAALTFYFCVNSLLTTGQAVFLHQPAVKSYFNLTLPKMSKSKKPVLDEEDVELWRRSVEELRFRAAMEKLRLEKEKEEETRQEVEKNESFEEGKKKKKRL